VSIRRFEGRNVVVTGAGQGIGRAIADRFAAEDADVMLIGRRPGPLELAVQEIAAAGGSAWTHPADVSDAAAVDGAVAAALERWE
jgi:NAD(P)-dependent dehydrogenase (short-subunit alcohol dehydrogenase family)